MANRRSLWKTISTSEKLNCEIPTVIADLAEFTQLLYTWIIPHCDDFGRMAGSAWTVKAQVMPGSQRTVEEFDRALSALAKVELIVRYSVNGDHFLQVTKWEEHQDGLHKRTASKCPEPPPLPGSSGNPPEDFGSPPMKRREPKRSEPNGREEKNSPPSPSRADADGKTAGTAGDGEIDVGEWNNDIFEFVVKQAPDMWRYLIRQRGKKVRTHRPSFVLATIMDVKKAKQKPKDHDEAIAWIMGRLKAQRPPSDDNYDEAKRLLRMAVEP